MKHLINYFRKGKKSLQEPQITINKIVANLRKNLSQMATYGKNEGKKGLPERSVTGLCTTEKKFAAQCYSKLNEVRSIFEPQIAALTKQIEHTKEKLAKLKPKTLEVCTQILDSEKASIVAAAAAKYETRTIAIKEELAPCNVQVKEIGANLVEQKDLIGFTPMLRWYNTSLGYFAILLAIGLLEMPFNYPGALQMGLSNTFALMATVALTLYLVLTAHLLGDSLAQKYKFELYASITMAIVMITAIIEFRGKENIDLVAINIVVLLIGCIYAKKRSKFRRYFILLKQYKASKQQQKQLQTNLKETEEHERKERKQIDSQFEKKAEEMAFGEQRILEAELQSKGLQLENFQSLLSQTEKTIDGIFQEGVLAYRQANEEACKLHADATPRQAEDPPSLLFSSVKFPDQILKIENRGSTSIATTIILFLCSMLLSLSSCDFNRADFAPSVTAVTVLFDGTTNYDFDNTAERISDYVTENIIGFDSDISRDGALVHVSTIGEVSVQRTQTVQLPVGENYFTRIELERQQELENFQTYLSQAIESSLPSNEASDQSRVNRNLCQHLPTLINTEADRKVLLIFSDLIQNSQVVSFYSYRKNPEKLLTHYDKIAKKLQEDCSLGPLNDLEIIVIHLPTKTDDELFTASKWFWVKYFTDLGVKDISFIANI